MASLVLVGSVEGLHHTGREPRPRPFHSLHRRQFPVRDETESNKVSCGCDHFDICSNSKYIPKCHGCKGRRCCCYKKTLSRCSPISSQAKAKMVAMAVLMSIFIEESKGNAG